MQNIPAPLLMGIDLKILIPRSIGTVEPLIINIPSSQQQTISYERLLGSRIVTCHLVTASTWLQHKLQHLHPLNKRQLGVLLDNYGL